MLENSLERERERVTFELHIKNIKYVYNEGKTLGIDNHHPTRGEVSVVVETKMVVSVFSVELGGTG